MYIYEHSEAVSEYANKVKIKLKGYVRSKNITIGISRISTWMYATIYVILYRTLRFYRFLYSTTHAI